MYPSRMEIANRTNLCERLSQHKQRSGGAAPLPKEKGSAADEEETRNARDKRQQMGSWEGQKRRPVGWGI